MSPDRLRDIIRHHVHFANGILERDAREAEASMLLALDALEAVRSVPQTAAEYARLKLALSRFFSAVKP